MFSLACFVYVVCFVGHFSNSHSFCIISGSSNTPRTLAWLLLFWRERYLVWVLFSFFDFLLNIWSPMDFLLFQTVAECVLFYYLTKKNENYKNIVRRNYRRRGRSQVLLQFCTVMYCHVKKCSLIFNVLTTKKINCKGRERFSLPESVLKLNYFN